MVRGEDFYILDVNPFVESDPSHRCKRPASVTNLTFFG